MLRVPLDDRSVLGDQLLERRRAEVRIGLRLLALLDSVERILEQLAVDPEHDLAEELDESAMRIERETTVLGECREPFERRRVEAEVEDGVHHSGHREFRAAAHADEQRVARIAKTFAGRLLDDRERLLHLLPEPVREFRAARVEGVARLGGDREPGRHRQPGARHLRNAGTLAAQQVAHRGTALVEAIHPLVGARPRRRDPVLRAAVCRAAVLLCATAFSTTSCPGCLPPLASPHRAGWCVRNVRSQGVSVASGRREAEPRWRTHPGARGRPVRAIRPSRKASSGSDAPSACSTPHASAGR